MLALNSMDWVYLRKWVKSRILAERPKLARAPARVSPPRLMPARTGNPTRDAKAPQALREVTPTRKESRKITPGKSSIVGFTQNTGLFAQHS